MFDVSYTTNVREWDKNPFPKTLATRPMIGEWVKSNDDKIVAKIVSITHCSSHQNLEKLEKPYLLLELHTISS